MKKVVISELRGSKPCCYHYFPSTACGCCIFTFTGCCMCLISHLRRYDLRGLTQTGSDGTWKQTRRVFGGQCGHDACCRNAVIDSIGSELLHRAVYLNLDMIFTCTTKTTGYFKKPDHDVNEAGPRLPSPTCAVCVSLRDGYFNKSALRSASHASHYDPQIVKRRKRRRRGDCRKEWRADADGMGGLGRWSDAPVSSFPCQIQYLHLMCHSLPVNLSF